MPTKKEAQELIDKCKIQYYQSKGKYLVKIIGPNGNFIILPSTGYLDGTAGKYNKYRNYNVWLYIGELYSPVNLEEYSENKAAFLFIGDTWDTMYNPIRESTIGVVNRYKLLPVRAVMDK